MALAQVSVLTGVQARGIFGIEEFEHAVFQAEG